MNYPKSIEIMIQEFSKFPSIGPKTAERLAFFLIFQEKDFTNVFTDNVRQARELIRFCSICGNIDEKDPCRICANGGRDRSKICVVENPRDLFAIEKADVFDGLYHVLGGALAPLDGMTPKKLNFETLHERLKNGVKELIIATNSNVPGEMTALYIRKHFQSYPVRITRIAKGVPFGGDLEYSDKVTISNAFSGRRMFENDSSE